MNRQRVVITGMGVVSPIGLNAESFAASLHAGRSGIRPLDFDRARLRSTVAASCAGWNPTTIMDTGELRRVPRMVPMAIAAGREALESAALRIDPADLDAQRRVAVVLGTGGGGLAYIEEQYRVLFSDGKPSLYSITAGTHGNLSSEISIALHLRGPSHVISTGCTSSTDAIGYAAMMIRAGVVPAALVGGADSPISPGILGGFERMRVVSTREHADPANASRPFSADRDGFILGEGAWMFVLEDADHARARGATVLAEVAGYASTCDAFHRVQIAPDVVEPARAIALAMEQAGVTPADVDYVNYHGTGTELNDRLETLAVKKALGDPARRVAGSSTKSMIGHPQGACGAAGIAATIAMMRGRFVHPTLNLHQPDPACDLDYTPLVARAATIRTALCNCIAFGSKNSAIILRSPA